MERQPLQSMVGVRDSGEPCAEEPRTSAPKDMRNPKPPSMSAPPMSCKRMPVLGDCSRPSQSTLMPPAVAIGTSAIEVQLIDDQRGNEEPASSVEGTTAAATRTASHSQFRGIPSSVAPTASALGNAVPSDMQPRPSAVGGASIGTTAGFHSPVILSRASQIRVATDCQHVESLQGVGVPSTFYECFLRNDLQRVAIRSATSATQGGCSMEPKAAPRGITYEWLLTFAHGHGNLRRRGVEQDDIVALLFPEGPELAVALVVFMMQAAVAPLDVTRLSDEESNSALRQFRAAHAVVLREHKVYDEHIAYACELADCHMHHVIRGSRAGSFQFVEPPVVRAAFPVWLPVDGLALVLRTSGSTAMPKVVPITPRALYVGGMCLGEGLGLRPDDVCLNAMPLTHIGAICCSLFSSLFHGGTVICATGFDPKVFLQWLEDLEPTWYYAVPTIHKALMMVCKNLSINPNTRLRFIRSGGADLTDADARQLTRMFSCPVFPTYSMTECMPIAQPLQDYRLNKPGSVGVPLACSICVVGENGERLPFGQDGEVCVRGQIVSRGYLNEQAEANLFFGEPDFAGFQWFRTGDIGHVDEQGYLFLTGRKKDVIKRGGEQVNPLEVEKVLLRHPAVQLAAVFGVPNNFWGEEVAAAVVLAPSYGTVEDSRSSATTRGSKLTGQPLFATQVSANRRASSMRIQEQLKDDSGADATAEGSSAAGVATTPSEVTSKKSGAGGVPSVISQQHLHAYLAAQIQAVKIPRQIIFLSSVAGLPMTPSGKISRRDLATHFCLSSVDVSAMDALMSCTEEGYAEWDANGQFSLKKTPGNVRISPAIKGVRFFFAVWVMFFHIGELPSALHALRSFSVSVTGFLVLAGFVLSSSVTRPIEDIQGFYRCRIIAAQPLYFLAGLYTVPLMFIHTSPWIPSLIYAFLVVSLNQLAWPWGGILLNTEEDWMLWPNTPMWFVSVYFFCLMVFPYLYTGLTTMRFFNCWASPDQPCMALGRHRCVFTKFCCWPVLSLGVLFTASILGAWIVIDTVDIPLVEKPVLDFLAYIFPPFWLGPFFLGMLTFNLFEMHRRGGADLWRHWGKLTDAISLSLLVLLVLTSLASEGTIEGADLFTRFGRFWSGPMRLSTGVMCVWIYGLATGEGLTAKLLSTNFFAEWLAPTSYPICLFHWPNTLYWMFCIHGTTGNKAVREASSVELLLIAALTTWQGWVLAHYFSTYWTQCFMRLFGLLCVCWKQTATPADASDGADRVLLEVIAVIQGLTGAEVDPSTPLKECGLDSFSCFALLGMLRTSFPLMDLTPMQVNALATVGDLAVEIEACYADPDLVPDGIAGSSAQGKEDGHCAAVGAAQMAGASGLPSHGESNAQRCDSTRQSNLSARPTNEETYERFEIIPA